MASGLSLSQSTIMGPLQHMSSPSGFEHVCALWTVPCVSSVGAVPVGLRFRRGRALGFALIRVIGGGLPPRRCACTVSCALVCASVACSGFGQHTGHLE